MAELNVELALARVMAYLEASGVEVTREVMLTALRLVQEALEDPRNDPLAFIVDQVPERFRLPVVPLPPAFPEISRGSIGYDDFR